MKRSNVLITLLGLVMISWFGKVHAQENSKTLPTAPAEFIEELNNRLKKFGGKEIHEYMETFTARWSGGDFTISEQERFIGHVNLMLLKNYSLETEVFSYVEIFNMIKTEENPGKINTEEFFAVTDSCIQELNRDQVRKYIKFLKVFSTDAAAFKTSNASWKFSNPTPKLTFGRTKDKELDKVFISPLMTFETTDLIYSSTQDSNRIAGTKGVLNLLNKVWRASGGRLDWSKVGLDPNDVYAEIKNDYMLNLNYAHINIDTVKFHYNSLLPGTELNGRYEDINKGYRNVNKANYPYFRSYDGGVVIDNFIPNVRYEGGFSLRGVKKIGSAYFKEVDYVEEEQPAPKGEKPDEAPEEEDDAFDWSQFGIDENSEDNPFWLDEEDEVMEDDYWEDTEPDGPSESDDPTGGGEFEGEDPYFPTFPTKIQKLVKAQLTIFRGSEPAMKLRALEFVLDMEKLVSKRTEAALFIGESDSITHPSLDVLYLVDSSEVYLMKDVKDKRSRTPYLSPFHKYYMYFDAVKWNTNENKIEFTSIIDKENQISAIESKDFYKKERWDQFKGLLPIHPIGAIYRFEALNPGISITPAGILDEHKLGEYLDAFKVELVNLEGSGFILYDRKSEEIHPLPKLYDWAKAARDRKDYDAIQILSQVDKGNNATLDLVSKNIMMNGVKFFSLSDSQFVRVLPFEEKVEILEDRDLNFGGIVAAGKLNFYGQANNQFKFEYDNYKILCDSLDSLRFILVRNPEMGFTFSPLQKALRNTSIEGVTGAIYINKPNNKNGLDVYPEYSVFDSYTNSYVYWAKPDVKGGVYSKEKLYFSIDPFVLDSLETFDESKLSFEGEFYSSEIFPRIRQKLTVMDDFTLGLKEITPDTGYSAYDGKGRFYDEIRLDGKGLQGKGKLEYLHTTAESDTFEFYFDSVKAVTKSFFLPGGEKDGAWFPEIKATQVDYKWLTKEDKVILVSDENNPIDLFQGEGKFVGELQITPEGLKGNGTLTLDNVSITSEELLFKEKDFKANRGTFRVADRNDPEKFLYVSENVNIDYDVNSHHSEFQAVEMGVANSSFPEQQYKTSLAKGTYDKSTNDLYLEAVSPKQKDNYFYSTAKSQDSLAFNGLKAYYNFDQKEIKVDSVPHIYVADAKITPDGGKVTVKFDGYVQKLSNTVVEANQETNYHRMYEAEIEILSSKNYTGKGKYDYIPVNDQDQYIDFTEIKVEKDSTLNTVAKGVIPEEQNFFLTERIIFTGETQLSAQDKYMYFKGKVKIDSENEFFKDAWFEFEDEVNPDSVFVKINQENLGKLVVGLHYIPRYRVFYSTFLQPKKDAQDKDVAIAGGGLTFDRNTKEFRIGPKDKLNGKAYRGTTSSFNDETNVITTQGLLDFPFNFVKNTIEAEFSGSWRDDMGNNEVKAELVMALNWKIVPKEAWAKLVEKFRLQTTANDNIEFTNQLLTFSLAELLDKGGKKEEKTNEFIKGVQNSVIYNDIKVAKDLPYSLVLTNVRFTYDPEYKSLYANGDVGIVGMNGEWINKMSSTNTKIEYNIGKVTPTGVPLSDTLRIYLEADEFTSVYMEYYQDVLNTWSTDEVGFNQILKDEIAKRKKEDGFRFNVVTDYEKNEFISRFINRYIWRE